MERSDALHHEISELKLIVQIQDKQIKNLSGWPEDESIKIIRDAMWTVQEKNLKVLAEKIEELKRETN